MRCHKNIQIPPVYLPHVPTISPKLGPRVLFLKPAFLMEKSASWNRLDFGVLEKPAIKKIVQFHISSAQGLSHGYSRYRASFGHGRSREASVVVDSHIRFMCIMFIYVYGTCMSTTYHTKSVCPGTSALEFPMPLNAQRLRSNHIPAPPSRE